MPVMLNVPDMLPDATLNSPVPKALSSRFWISDPAARPSAMLPGAGVVVAVVEPEGIPDRVKLPKVRTGLALEVMPESATCADDGAVMMSEAEPVPVMVMVPSVLLVNVKVLPNFVLRAVWRLDADREMFPVVTPELVSVRLKKPGVKVVWPEMVPRVEVVSLAMLSTGAVPEPM